MYSAQRWSSNFVPEWNKGLTYLPAHVEVPQGRVVGTFVPVTVVSLQQWQQSHALRCLTAKHRCCWMGKKNKTTVSVRGAGWVRVDMRANPRRPFKMSPLLWKLKKLRNGILSIQVRFFLSAIKMNQSVKIDLHLEFHFVIQFLVFVTNRGRHCTVRLQLVAVL